MRTIEEIQDALLIPKAYIFRIKSPDNFRISVSFKKPKNFCSILLERYGAVPLLQAYLRLINKPLDYCDNLDENQFSYFIDEFKSWLCNTDERNILGHFPEDKKEGLIQKLEERLDEDKKREERCHDLLNDLHERYQGLEFD